MYNDIVIEAIKTVTKIFIDADVQVLPEYEEIREEFEILDKVYITDEMIREVHFQIAYHLDDRYPDVSPGGEWHVTEVMAMWNRRTGGRFTSHATQKLNISGSKYESSNKKFI